MGANFIRRSKRGLPILRKLWSKQLPVQGASSRSKRYSASGITHIALQAVVKTASGSRWKFKALAGLPTLQAVVKTASGSGINIGPDAYYRNLASQEMDILSGSCN